MVCNACRKSVVLLPTTNLRIAFIVPIDAPVHGNSRGQGTLHSVPFDHSLMSPNRLP
jgi:hypothetical protein